MDDAMTHTEQSFMRELKALLDKYQVGFAKDRIYYPGDSEAPRFVFPTEKGQTIISIDDMADLRGGFNES